MTMKLRITPVTIVEAKVFIAEHHRHHKPPTSALFAVAVSDERDVVRGVATVGRPSARMIQDGYTAEVTRLCTDGAPNACSMLYSAAWRAARALGYGRLVTYTLPEEGGTSLRAAGWKLVNTTGGNSWSRKERPRVDLHPLQMKMKWQIDSGAGRGESGARPGASSVAYVQGRDEVGH